MAAYYTEPDFKGKPKLTIMFRFLDFLSFWYKIFKIRSRFAFIFDMVFKLKQKWKNIHDN